MRLGNKRANHRRQACDYGIKATHIKPVSLTSKLLLEAKTHWTADARERVQTSSMQIAKGCSKLCWRYRASSITKSKLGTSKLQSSSLTSVSICAFLASLQCASMPNMIKCKFATRIKQSLITHEAYSGSHDPCIRRQRLRDHDQIAHPQMSRSSKHKQMAHRPCAERSNYPDQA